MSQNVSRFQQINVRVNMLRNGAWLSNAWISKFKDTWKQYFQRQGRVKNFPTIDLNKCINFCLPKSPKSLISRYVRKAHTCQHTLHDSVIRFGNLFFVCSWRVFIPEKLHFEMLFAVHFHQICSYMHKFVIHFLNTFSGHCISLFQKNFWAEWTIKNIKWNFWGLLKRRVPTEVTFQEGPDFTHFIVFWINMGRVDMFFINCDS